VSGALDFTNPARCDLCLEFGRNEPACVTATISMAEHFPSYHLCLPCLAEIGEYVEGFGRLSILLTTALGLAIMPTATAGGPVAGDTCHACGYTTDTVTGLYGDSTPAEGDVSVCLRCASPAVFTGHGLTTRAPTPTERARMLDDKGVVDAIAAVMLSGPPGAG
jgi:hypothetical protein